jgi:hypothetical protein
MDPELAVVLAAILVADANDLLEQLEKLGDTGTFGHAVVGPRVKVVVVDDKVVSVPGLDKELTVC